MSAPATRDEIHEVNVRYHDLAAEHYDAKWGIGYGELGQRQVTAKVAKALGERPLRRRRRALEIGAGTGYFGLNLVRAGIVDEYTATDISPRMIGVLRRSASALGIDARAEVCDAAALPFGDGSFDLVFGHAVLHHLPELDASFAEFRRVLAPGGAFAFCGEPSHYGDRVAEVPKRLAIAAAPTWRRLVRAGERRNGHSEGREEDMLERVVDVHAFTPGDLQRRAEAAGFGDVRVGGEELAASLFGWANRALEGSADPDSVPWLWRQYAYRGYLALQALDRAVLERRLPAAIFYNLLVSGRVPA